MKRSERPKIKLSLKCSCGASAYGRVSPAVAAMKIRDIFIRTHANEGCVVTDKSVVPNQIVFLRQAPS